MAMTMPVVIKQNKGIFKFKFKIFPENFFQLNNVSGVKLSGWLVGLTVENFKINNSMGNELGFCVAMKKKNKFNFFKIILSLMAWK